MCDFNSIKWFKKKKSLDFVWVKTCHFWVRMWRKQPHLCFVSVPGQCGTWVERRSGHQGTCWQVTHRGVPLKKAKAMRVNWRDRQRGSGRKSRVSLPGLDSLGAAQSPLSPPPKPTVALNRTYWPNYHAIKHFPQEQEGNKSITSEQVEYANIWNVVIKTRNSVSEIHHWGLY